MPIKAIARVIGCSRNTVRATLASDGPPKYAPAPVGSIVDAVEPRIRELLQAYPTMPATVIAERIGSSGSSAGTIRNDATPSPTTFEALHSGSAQTG